MDKTLSVRHVDGLRFAAEVRGHRVIIDQPDKSGGMDRGPTPPELFVTALASCIGTYVVEYCHNAGIIVDGMCMDCSWIGEQDPIRLTEVHVRVHIPAELSTGRKNAIIRVAEHCTLTNSLAGTPAITLEVIDRSHEPEPMIAPV